MAKDETRTRILDAAGPIFAEKGYRAATVREICRAAEVNVASVNYYFGDKERLYIETVKRAHPASSGKEPMPDWPPRTPPDTKLRQFIHTLLRRILSIDQTGWQMQLLMREMHYPTAARGELVENFLRVDFQRLLGILDEILPAEAPEHRRNQMALSVISQCVHYRAFGDLVAVLVDDAQWEEHYSVEQLTEHISQVCLAALGLEPPLPSRWGETSDDEAPCGVTDINP